MILFRIAAFNHLLFLDIYYFLFLRGFILCNLEINRSHCSIFEHITNVNDTVS